MAVRQGRMLLRRDEPYVGKPIFAILRKMIIIEYSDSHGHPGKDVARRPFPCVSAKRATAALKT